MPAFRMFNKTAGTGQGEYLDNGYIGGFCMDLSEYVAHDSLTYDVIMPQDGPRPTSFLGESMGQAKADYISELWGRFYDPAWSAGGSYTYQQNKNAEAFAAAVWEIIYEDLPTSSSAWDVTVDSTGGSRGFKATNLDYQKANAWLGALDGTGPIADLRALSYVGAQDFIVEIPEPSSIAIFAVSGLCFLIRKNRTSPDASGLKI
ncbi:MAG: PEP-CTERM sorting domain-containing protein [Planctomycetes bacterium]|nr:PEP-CTERM sorting domain-containing protein [Planctomycetota bacterium]